MTQPHNERLVFLMGEVALGNRSSFETLYSETSKHLYPIGLKMLQSTELAEEALQETYIKIWHNAGSYQVDLGNVMSWMISILRYRALDMIRYRKVRKNETLVDDLPELPEDSESKAWDSDEAELFEIDRCMSELDMNQRQAIHLAYFKGLTHAEIMDHMRSALGSVKSWIRRGLISLERCLSR